MLVGPISLKVHAPPPLLTYTPTETPELVLRDIFKRHCAEDMYDKLLNIMNSILCTYMYGNENEACPWWDPDQRIKTTLAEFPTSSLFDAAHWKETEHVMSKAVKGKWPELAATTKIINHTAIKDNQYCNKWRHDHVWLYELHRVGKQREFHASLIGTVLRFDNAVICPGNHVGSDHGAF